MAGTAADLFFWNDYQGDPKLRLCSLAAQGLWMRFLCLMAESTKKGYLLITGEKKPTAVQLAQIIGCSKDDVMRYGAELEKYGVYSRDSQGVIYSRRMVEHNKARQARVRGGQAAGRVNVEKKRGIWSSMEQPAHAPIPLPKPVPKPRPVKTSSLRSEVCAEPSRAAALDEGVTIFLPTNKFATAAEVVIIRSVHADHLQTLYPGVDVAQQLRAMRGWLETHPAKRKTPNGMPAFVNGWLDREQNRGGHDGMTAGLGGSAQPQARAGDRKVIQLFGGEEAEQA